MSEATATPVEPTSSEAADALRAFVERAEFVLAEITSLKEDVAGIFSEAKGQGYDVKALRRVIALRKKDADERKQEEAVELLYREALGLV